MNENTTNSNTENVVNHIYYNGCCSKHNIGALEKEPVEVLEPDYKMVILIRDDIDMSEGKFGVQIHQVTTMTLLETIKKEGGIEGSVRYWMQNGIKCVLAAVPDLYELIELKGKLDGFDIPNYLITDLGITEFGILEEVDGKKKFKPQPTTTALGIGPVDSRVIDEFTRGYPLYKPNEEYLKEMGFDGIQDIVNYIRDSRNLAVEIARELTPKMQLKNKFIRDLSNEELEQMIEERKITKDEIACKTGKD